MKTKPFPLVALCNVLKQRSFQLLGGKAPRVPDRGSAPGPRWGLCPQTPVIGSAHSPWVLTPHFSSPSAAPDSVPKARLIVRSTSVWLKPVSHRAYGLYGQACTVNAYGHPKICPRYGLVRSARIRSLR